VENCVELGASPRATICWGRLVKVWALLSGRRTEVYPEDVQALARYVLGHRIWLGPHAASHVVTVEMVMDDIVDQVAVP
jgi:MoxR-like ATPase